MKLVLAIVNNDDSQTVLSELMRAEFSVTKLASSGGFLRVGNTTFMIGTEKERVEDLIKIIETYSSKRQEISASMPPHYSEAMFSSLPVQITVGGATVFVLDVEQFYRL